MFALWRTNPTGTRPSAGLVRTGAGIVAALALYGCGAHTPPPSDPAAAVNPATAEPNWLTSREFLPAPDTDRIQYEAEIRTLYLYDLPARDYWMVQLPGEPAGRLVAPHHRLPEGVDIAKTFVYYARAGVKLSEPVSVAQIEAGRLAHAGSLPNGN